MKAKSLTATERKWLAKLESVMKECPSNRLHCYTIGDNDLTFYDKNVADVWESKNQRHEYDAPQLHRAAGSLLAVVTGNFNIDSCAG